MNTQPEAQVSGFLFLRWLSGAALPKCFGAVGKRFRNMNAAGFFDAVEIGQGARDL